ncbi:DUF481 domain-containing protein [Novosphingobium sp.]|uniref:DUF481 domain-containing protein n=1 Tax=Novosphingobium sp. TaxID=1874826 RepID=UPI00263A1F1C|nr:DUF481 domain-containing protein [Novosphingobium sp.]
MSACLLVAALTMATPALAAQTALSQAPTQAAPAAAPDTDLPPAVALILDAALQSGDAAQLDAVVRTIKSALPQAVAAIDLHIAVWPKLADARALAALTAPVNLAPVQSPVPLPVSTPLPQRADGGVIVAAAVKITGEGEAGAFKNTGNAPGIGLVGGFKLLAEGQNWRIGTVARADYQETSGIVTREQYRFSAEPNYKFDERGYVFGLGQYEQDRFQGFASRYSISGGLGYKVLNAEYAKINVKAGPAWRVTEPLEAERESVVAGLASLEAKVTLSPGLQYSQDASIYSDATGSTFYTLAALDSKLIGKLKARLSYMVQHETAPELGRLGTDTTSRLTLVYGF